jgi:hypothetical protein
MRCANRFKKFTAHHAERNHQGLGNRLILPDSAHVVSTTDEILRRERLGGMLNYYYREAA